MSKINGEVINITVKAKKVKSRGEDGTVYEDVQRIGRITLEFDGGSVDVGELQKFVHGRYITLALEDPRYKLDG